MKKITFAIALLLAGTTNQVKISQHAKNWDSNEDNVEEGSLEGYQDAVEEVFKENEAASRPQKKIHIDAVKKPQPESPPVALQQLTQPQPQVQAQQPAFEETR